MIAYRLHFETTNLQAIELVKSGKIGTPRFFLSSFSQQVKEGDIRLNPELGGGSVYDMGIYCINAARYIFQAEPSEVVSTGDLLVEPAYEYSTGLRYELTLNGKKEHDSFPKRDQFAPELLYFSECILTDKQPEPSGREGLADVRVIQALYHSAISHQPVSLTNFEPGARPDRDQEITRPPTSMPHLIHASSPSGT
jgi:glucose-fructose oxidoreductase